MRRFILLAGCLAIAVASRTWADTPEKGSSAAAAPACCDRANCEDPACEKKHALDEEVQYIVSDDVLAIDKAIPTGDLGQLFKSSVGWQRGGAELERTKIAPTYYFSPANAYADPHTACEPSYGYATPSPTRYAPAYASTSCPADERTAHKIAHLRQSAEHFRAAGKPEMASQIMTEAQRVERMHAQVQFKLAELTAERDHIDRQIHMIRQTGQLAPRQVMLDVQVIDVDLKKLQSLGLAVFALESLASKSIPDFIESLKSSGLAEVISAPKLVTVSGRSASIQVGGELPIVAKTAYAPHAARYAMPNAHGAEPNQTAFIGTKAEFLPEVLDDDTIRLHVKLNVSGPAACPETSASASNVAVHDFALETMIETKPGEVTLLNRTGSHGCAKSTSTAGAPPAPPVQCPADCDKHISHIERIVLIRPTLIEELPPARPWVQTVPHPVMPAQAVWPIPQHVFPHPPVASPAPVPPPAPVAPQAPATATLPNPYAF